VGVAPAAWAARVRGKVGGRRVPLRWTTPALGRWTPALGDVWRTCMGLRNVPPTGLVRTTRRARLRKLRRALPHGRRASVRASVRASPTGLWVNLLCGGRS